MGNLSEQVRARTEKATVRTMRPNTEGVLGPVAQGVLVPGGYILTAAHCINWDGEGAMALGDWYIETIQASDGTQYKVSPYAIELLTDIAVLGAVDGQALFDECLAYEDFCEATEPVHISDDDLLPAVAYAGPRTPAVENPPTPVHVLTHKGAWVTGRASRHGLDLHGIIGVSFDTPIEGGTSGGPVINNNGLLVGVISWSGGQGSKKDGGNGPIPRPHLALPAWMWRRIKG